MKFLKNNKGFTLIEMVSVILVLGIISAVAIPMFDQGSINATLVANTVQTDIQFTQELAMSRNQNASITFNWGSNSYNLPTDVNSIFPSETRKLPQGVMFTSPTPPPPGPPPVGSTIVTFNRHGETSSAGSLVRLNASGTFITVTIQGYTGRTTVP
jgi:MSHA pilin protein MshC